MTRSFCELTEPEKNDPFYDTIASPLWVPVTALGSFRLLRLPNARLRRANCSRHKTSNKHHRQVFLTSSSSCYWSNIHADRAVGLLREGVVFLNDRRWVVLRRTNPTYKQLGDIWHVSLKLQQDFWFKVVSWFGEFTAEVAKRSIRKASAVALCKTLICHRVESER